MSNTFRTEADVMVTTAGQVDNTNSEVQSELSRLRGVVDGLRGAWSGQAMRSRASEKIFALMLAPSKTWKPAMRNHSTMWEADWSCNSYL